MCVRNSIIAFSLLASLTGMAQAPTKDTPLTNQEVIKLCKLDLGDDVVVAKINQAKYVDFKLETGDLSSLKSQGVSKAVITAMLKRSTAAAAEASSSSMVMGPYGGAVVTTSGGPSARMVTKDGEFDLRSIAGSPSQTWAYVTVLSFMDYPGLKADVRTKDHKPTFIVRSQQSPVGRYFLVKAESNKKDLTRSVKMGSRGMFTNKSVTNPDKDWTVIFTAKEQGNGFWQIKPEKELEPGEYGIWFRDSELYDFGVD